MVMDMFLGMEHLVIMDMQPMDTMDMVATVPDTTVNVRPTLMLMPTLSTRYIMDFPYTMPMLQAIHTILES